MSSRGETNISRKEITCCERWVYIHNGLDIRVMYGRSRVPGAWVVSPPDKFFWPLLLIGMDRGFSWWPPFPMSNYHLGRWKKELPRLVLKTVFHSLLAWSAYHTMPKTPKPCSFILEYLVFESATNLQLVQATHRLGVSKVHPPTLCLVRSTSNMVEYTQPPNYRNWHREMPGYSEGLNTLDARAGLNPRV